MAFVVRAPLVHVAGYLWTLSLLRLHTFSFVTHWWETCGDLGMCVPSVQGQYVLVQVPKYSIQGTLYRTSDELNGRNLLSGSRTG